MPNIWWINYSFEILPKGNSSQAALSMLFTFIGFPPKTPFPTSRQSGPRFCSGIHYFKKVTLSSVSHKFWEVQANGGNTIFLTVICLQLSMWPSLCGWKVKGNMLMGHMGKFPHYEKEIQGKDSSFFYVWYCVCA